MTAYVAPARFTLTELHEPAPGDGEPVTICGLPMAEDELWLPCELREGDRVCAGCSGSAPGEAEVTLW